MKNQSPLDNVYLASPCSMPWESMVGNERERNCNGCSKTVYNISDMTRLEAEAFLLERGTSECLKFYRRADGTIMTDDCPRALRKIRDTCKLAAKIAVGLVAFMVSLPGARAQSVEDADPAFAGHKQGDVGYKVPPIIYPSVSGSVFPARRPHPREMRGGPWPTRYPIITETIAPNSNSATPPITVSTEARIVTKEHTLPNGKKVTLVTPDDNGKIISVDPIERSAPGQNANRFIDTRTSVLFSQARHALDSKNFQLAEFYLEKALVMFDQQKDGDPEFRKLIETELKNLRARNSSSSSNESNTCGTGPQIDAESNSNDQLKFLP